MMVSFLQNARKSFKWYRKLLFHLLDLAVLNSQILYNVHSGENITHANFQLILCKEILQKFHIPRPTNTSGRPSKSEEPLRLRETTVPPTPKKANPTRQCNVCSYTTLGERKRREIRYMCAKYCIAFYVKPWFYYTLLKY
jgi:hypothetical protein